MAGRDQYGAGQCLESTGLVEGILSIVPVNSQPLSLSRPPVPFDRSRVFLREQAC
jgi:hypothetical protein